jgi:uncharacterized protein YjbJ (UPF0337 family)
MGAFEEAKGKVKQAVGDLTDDAGIKEEGYAQERKAEHERDEARAREDAQKHREKAEAYEAEDSRSR